ncbi:MAG TPA: hypothetical protein VF245_01370 [Solirubrobacterales bacterium]
MVSAGTYILGVLALVAVGLSVGFSAYRLRRRLLPAWDGASARLVEVVVAVALLIWIGEVLGTLGVFYAWAFVIAAVGLAAASSTLPAGPVAAGDPPPLPVAKASSGAVPPTAPPAGGGSWLAWVVTVGVIALVVAHWGLTTKDALDRGIFNFDSLWYHMPFAVDMVQSHSTTGLHYPETVFTNWFYPQNSELLHSIGILLTQRDMLSLFLNFGFLGLAFLAAWCIGRPYSRGHLTVVAAAILLECHTLVVREPGAAKNDLVAAALLLAAAAILVTAYARHPQAVASSALTWPIAAAGLAVGLAVGTKSTAVAMAFALTVAVIALAPVGRRWAAAGWWLVPAFLGGGYWFVRNLIVAGNPLPQATSIGPISLPHPERLQEGRPDFSIVHYATDTGVWREYFVPGLHQAFGVLWPLTIALAVAGGVLVLIRGDRVLRWMAAVALFSLLAYLFTPLSAAGAEGAPTGFGINIRYAVPALLLGLTLLPLAFKRLDGWREWALLGALLAVLVVTNRADAVLRDPSRPFALALAFLVVVLPALILLWGYRAAGNRRPSLLIGGFGALILLIAALGYPLQRHYLESRFDRTSEIPGMHLDAAYAWARDKHDFRIGLAGTAAGFLQYGLYGTDLSNRVTYLGEKGPHGAYNAIPTCAAFRAAVNAANLEYLITAPFLNFLNPAHPISSPESLWLRNEKSVSPILKSGPVTIWRIEGKLDPTSCGPANAPLRKIPNTPEAG